MADNKFTNRLRLARRLKAIPEKVRVEVRDELDRRRVFLEEQIRAAAPVDTGHLARLVRSSPAASIGGRIRATVFTQDPPAEADDRKARSVEFGRADMAARPFFFPVYRAFRRRIRNALSRAAKKGARKAVGEL